ncbi:MAG: integrase core domain-containing protein, partial [Kosmotogaceae bacterium]
MAYGFYKTARLVHFLNKDRQRKWKDKYTLLRGVAEKLELSPKAKQRLEWMIFYNTVAKRNTAYTAKYFGISRKTVHKWLGRYDESNLRTLEEKSRAPVKRRSWEVTLKEEERIITLRKETKCKYGKVKLKKMYFDKYHEIISTWKIERVIRKHKLYREKEVKKSETEAKRKKKRKKSIHSVIKKDDFGFLWHIDAIILYWYGARRVIFTAIEDITKIAFARVYTTNKSDYAADFLKRLMFLVQGKVEIMHSDNGSEFEKEFRKTCIDLGIEQVFSRPNTPKDNPSIERFNWTVQDEWLAFSDVGLDDINRANQDLTKWLIEYNNVRPHQSLDYMTPLEYTQVHFS